MNYLAWAFCLYGALSLGSMATMSIGTVLLAVAILAASGGPKPLGQALCARTSSGWTRIYFYSALALAATCVLSLIVGMIAPLSYGGLSSKVHLFKDSLKLWYLFWPILLLVGLDKLSPDQRKKVLLAWLGAYGLVSVIGVAQHWVGWPRPQVIPNTEPLRYHATLFLGHHLSVASVWIFPFFAAVDFFMQSVREKSSRSLGLPAIAWGVLTLLGFVVLFFTYSRMLWVALPLGLFLWLLLTLPRRWTLGTVATLVVLSVASFQVPVVRARLQDKMGINERQELWKANLAIFSDRPLTGAGWLHNHELGGFYLMAQHPGQDVFSGHAHNNFLDVLAGTGILGMAAWLFWCGLVIWMAARSRNVPGAFATGLVCAWFVFQLNGLTQVNFWEAKVTHQMMWMVAWTLLWGEMRERQLS